MVTLVFVGLILTILFTPGPTNTLLATVGIQLGVRDALKFIPSEVVGYIIAINVWGFLIVTISQSFPWIPAILKLMSACYIVYMAVKLWLNTSQGLDQHSITRQSLFIATLFNPKALLFASAIFPSIVWVNATAYVEHMATFLVLIIPIAFLWIVFGHVLISNRIEWLNQRNLQRAASFILFSFAMPLSYSALITLN